MWCIIAIMAVVYMQLCTVWRKNNPLETYTSLLHVTENDVKHIMRLKYTRATPEETA